MNIYLVILLSLVIVAQLYTTYSSMDEDLEPIGVVITSVVVYGVYWWLTYMAGIFTLL